METWQIREGWVPGLLGWCVAEQARYHAGHAGFGLAFESRLAAEMAGFVRRLDPPRVAIFRAEDADGFLAAVSIDGDDQREGMARLRWFIAAERARGKGHGRRLLGRALAAARQAGCAGVWLETVAGLDAARALYDAAGFRLSAEGEAESWGRRVVEQRLELRFAGLSAGSGG
jgi:GNAT superfamily N-acetyltransferase